MSKKENIFRTLYRWFIRWFLGPKYEEKLLEKDKKNNEPSEIKFKDGVPDDSELIVSPAKQVLQRFLERKFAVISVFVVVVMFLVVCIVPYFMPKYYDEYTETTQKNVAPTMSMMSVPAKLKNNIKMIDSFGSFTVGLSNDGEVFVWGDTKIGATGLNVKNIPDEVKKANIVWVAAGQDHIVAIDDKGNFYGWGSNRFGQYAESTELLSNGNVETIPSDVANGKLDPTHIKKVTCGYQATAILMDDGRLYLWGNLNAYTNLLKFTGTSGHGIKGIKDVDFTLNYVVLLTEEADHIECGIPSLYSIVRTSIGGTGMAMADFLNGRKIASITATSTNVCILLEDGSMALAGDFPKDVVNVPNLPSDEYFTSVTAGTYHYSGVTNKGNIYCWGGDHFYQATVPSNLGAATKVISTGFQNYAITDEGKLTKTWGLKGYLFGTDENGADILSRVICGGKVTMTVGAIAVVIEIVIGVFLGCIAGYFGGWVDILIMRIAEVFGSIPIYPFMLIMNSLLAQVALTQNERLLMIMVILGVLGWPGFCSMTRAQILVARESEYVVAAQAMGVKETKIAFKHILPNIFSVILVNMTLSFAASMQTETSLSFLGFGVMFPQPSWGNMLSRASNATAAINFPWQWIFTSVILVFTTVCINTIGDTLRDVMDPKSSNDI